MQQRSLSITRVLTVTHATTIAWGNIVGLVVTAPEDGVYDLHSNLSTAYGTNRGAYFRLAINGNPVGGTGTEVRHTDTSFAFYFDVHMDAYNVALKAGDVVSAQSLYVTATSDITYGATSKEPSITIIKRGL
jgi:hypothetical protein